MTLLVTDDSYNSSLEGGCGRSGAGGGAPAHRPRQSFGGRVVSGQLPDKQAGNPYCRQGMREICFAVRAHGKSALPAEQAEIRPAGQARE